jgi:hypothetical protein
MSRRDFHRARRDSRLWAASAGGRSGLVAPVFRGNRLLNQINSFPADIGGRFGDGILLGNWSRIGTNVGLPGGRLDGARAVEGPNGNVWWFGMFSTSNDIRCVEYDVGDRTWTTRASTDLATQEPMGIVAVRDPSSDYTYIFGRGTGSAGNQAMVRYDHTANTYTSLATQSVTNRTRGIRGVYLGGAIYTVGGADGGNTPTNLTRCYIISSDTWDNTLIPNFPYAVYYGDVVAHEGRVYYFGGASPSATLMSDVYSWAPGETGWTAHQALDVPCWRHQVQRLNEWVYISPRQVGSGNTVGSRSGYDCRVMAYNLLNELTYIVSDENEVPYDDWNWQGMSHMSLVSNEIIIPWFFDTSAYVDEAWIYS